MTFGRTFSAACALLALSACGGDADTQDANGSADTNMMANDQSAMANQQQPAQDEGDPESIERARALAAQQGSEADRARVRDQARTEMQNLRLVVDQSDRELLIYRGDQLVQRHPVAVGTEENPTPIGDFAFHRVDLNPRWVPPDSDWAEDRDPQPPGDPDNPMGRARLVYQMPYTIHGTGDLNSLGKAVSHGSIRLANENVVPLAEMMLKAGGAWEGPSWFQRMTQNRTEEYQVPLEQDIPLQIQE